MSADKHKKRDRAAAFIRGLRNGWRGFPKGYAKMIVNGPLSPVARYCIDRGWATIHRTRPGELHRSYARHTVFDADTPKA